MGEVCLNDEHVMWDDEHVMWDDERREHRIACQRLPGTPAVCYRLRQIGFFIDKKFRVAQLFE